jgi:hypothetical protein
MPFYYPRSQLGYSNTSPVLSSQTAESTPDNAIDHHLTQTWITDPYFFKPLYNPTTGSYQNLYRIGTISYYLRRAKAGTTSVRAKVFNASLINNTYPLIGYSSSVSLPTSSSLAKFTFRSFQTAGGQAMPVFQDGQRILLGLFVDTSAVDNGVFLGLDNQTIATSQGILREIIPNGSVQLNSGFNFNNTIQGTGYTNYTNYNGRMPWLEVEYETAPEAPTNLNITGNLDTQQITVTWDRPTSLNDLSGGITTGFGFERYVYRYKLRQQDPWSENISYGSTSSTEQLDRTLVFGGILGETFSIEIGAVNATTGAVSFLATGLRATGSITLTRNDFSIPDNKVWLPAVSNVSYQDSITVSTNNRPVTIGRTWFDYLGNLIPDGIPGLSSTVNSPNPDQATVTISGSPRVIGQYTLRITMSATGQVTQTQNFDFNIYPKIAVFNGSSWVYNRIVKVFNGSQWVTPRTFKVFDGNSWIDPP